MSDSGPFVIVVGTDFSEMADRAVRHALVEAQARGPSEVHVVHVVEPRPFGTLAHFSLTPDRAIDLVRRHACDAVEHCLGDAAPGAACRVTAHYRHGSPAEGIVKLANDRRADLIVVGLSGKGASPSTGSVAERVERLAPCQVHFVRELDEVMHAQPFSRPRGHPPQPPDSKLRRSFASDGIHAAELLVYDSAARGAKEQSAVH
jgi:nucleotide-binding universal stress UspA family protein